MKKTDTYSSENILLDTLDRLAVLIDRDGKIIMLNKIAANFAGHDKSFLIGKPLFDFIPKDFPQNTKDRIINSIKKGEAYIFEENLKNEIFNITITPIFSKNKIQYIAVYSTNITKQKIAEKGLEEKERKYYSIFESAGDAIFLMKNDTFIDCNKKTLEMFNCASNEQIIGSSPIIFSPAVQPDGTDSKEKALAKINAAINGDNKPFYWKHKKADGSLFDASVTLNKIEIENTNYIQAIVRDITVEMRANEEIRHLSQLQESIIENANVWLNVLDIDGNVIMWNKAAEKISGYSKEEVIGHQKIWTLLYPDEEYRLKIFNKSSEIIHDNQTVENFETSITVKSGEKKIINWFSRNLSDEKGKSSGSVAMGIDFTEKQVAQEKLKKSEHRYRLLAENASDVIWTLDMGMKFTFVSPSIYRLTGYTVAEILNHPISEVLTPESYKKARDTIEKILYDANNEGFNSKSLTLEFQVKCKNKVPVWIEINSSFLLNTTDQPIGIIGVARNIDEKKKAESAKTDIEEQLRQSQKLEAVGRLAGGIAHDFNNMLTAIIVNADLLLISGNTDKRTTEGLNEIKKSSQRAASLTRQLLAFSKKQLLNPKILNISSLINKLEKMLVRIIDPNVKLVSTHEAKLKTVKADHGQIEQIIMNLVINASDSMVNGGEINIFAQNKLINKEYCHFNSEAYPGEFISVKIIDNGKGMEKNEIDHIFEPFYTTKEKGTGLGLSVVHGLIKQHNGWITVKSNPKSGTEFEFYIPVFHDPNIKSEMQENTIEEIFNGNGETILFVEDEESIRRIVDIALSNSNYNVLVAKDYDEAKKLYKKNKKKIDLIFSDIFLLNKNAFDLIDDLKIPDTMKIILTSGFSSNDIIWDKIVKLNIPFIQKPFPINSLLKLLWEILHN